MAQADIQRLLREFNAQDHSVELVVMQGETRIVAAKWSEGNQNWELTPGGAALLVPEKAPAKAPAKEPEKQKNLKGLVPPAPAGAAAAFGE